jgi:type VI secretion system protein VasG
MLPELSIALLERQMAGEEVTGITVGVADSLFVYTFEGAESPPQATAAPAIPEAVA